MIQPPDADVLIVGSGIMGSAAARLVREARPEARIVMLDGGRGIGSRPGIHLHDVDEPELWARYNEQTASGIQGFYAGAEPERTRATDVSTLESGIHLLSSVGEDSSRMPRAALAWNIGGMGAHWTAAVPWPAGDETFDFGEPERFARDLQTAQRVLRATSPAIGPTEPGDVVLRVLGQHFAGIGPADRAPQAMPMAAFPFGGTLHRVGPAVIFPPIGGEPDPHFLLLAGHLATAIETDGERATAVRARRTADGTEITLRARQIVVCADTFRTPQLLFASGIRPAALGRYLNEHAFITGRVLMELDRFGLRASELPTTAPGEFAVDSLWLPQNGPEQPFHGQIMNSTYVDDAGSPLAYGVGISLYTPVESRRENRVRFIDGENDLTGMPRFEVEFEYSATDVALIERARAEITRLSELFGPFDASTESALLPPGSSLHQTGTVRMGASDDGTSVCDTDGRVWGFDNLYLAGNGVVPTAVVANATLTGAVTAVRAAAALVRNLDTARA